MSNSQSALKWKKRGRRKHKAMFHLLKSFTSKQAHNGSNAQATAWGLQEINNTRFVDRSSVESLSNSRKNGIGDGRLNRILWHCSFVLRDRKQQASNTRSNLWRLNAQTPRNCLKTQNSPTLLSVLKLQFTCKCFTLVFNFLPPWECVYWL